jgi:hypothetical protein
VSRRTGCRRGEDGEVERRAMGESAGPGERRVMRFGTVRLGEGRMGGARREE